MQRLLNFIHANLPPGQNADNFTFPKLRALKLPWNEFSEMHLVVFSQWMPYLSRLDLSFTSIKQIFRPMEQPFSPMEKLMLTSTPLNISDLIAALSSMPHLKKLGLGALGGGRQVGMMGNATTLNDAALYKITDVLSNTCHDLEDVSLVGNTRLGVLQRSLRDFISRVGRRCKVSKNDHCLENSKQHTGSKPFLNKPPIE